MTITAAADGSALGNPGPAGWAWYIDDDCWRAGGWPHGTNNMGELKAVLDLLEATADDADQHLLVLCDSQYVINAVTTWMPGWKRKGWRKKDGKPVLNVELLQAIDRALQGRNVEFEWVRGHAGHAMNEAADERARAAATAFSRGQDPLVGPGYRAAGRGQQQGKPRQGKPGQGAQTQGVMTSGAQTQGAQTSGAQMEDAPRQSTQPQPDDLFSLFDGADSGPSLAEVPTSGDDLQVVSDLTRELLGGISTAEASVVSQHLHRQAVWVDHEGIVHSLDPQKGPGVDEDSAAVADLLERVLDRDASGGRVDDSDFVRIESAFTAGPESAVVTATEGGGELARTISAVWVQESGRWAVRLVHDTRRA